MGYAVLHVEKGAGSGGGLGNHIDRKEGKEHSFENANPDLKHLNINYDLNKYCTKEFTPAINSRISDGYKSNRKIRTDATKYCTVILTGSHKEMIHLQKEPEEFKKWIYKNEEFAKSEWGAENIVRFTLHLDETTPHIHCVFVPLTNDGRLSAKEVLGNRKNLANLQDRYGIDMKEFGLKRGLRGSKSKHETVQEYYGRIEREKKPEETTKIKIDEIVLKPSKADFFNLDTFHQKNKKKVSVAVKNFLESKQKQLHRLENENRTLKKELGQVKGHLYKLQENMGDLNQAQFSLKTSKDKITFHSEGEIFPIEYSKITKILEVKKFNTAIDKFPDKLVTTVVNAVYQNILKQVDLLDLSPNQIKKYTELGFDKLINHKDNFVYDVKGSKTNIQFSFREVNNRIFVDLKYPSKVEDNKIVSLTKEINRDKIDIIEDLKTSLEKAQKQLIPKKGRGI
jgi:hypothetical protein